MAAIAKLRTTANTKSRRGVEDPVWVKWTLLFLAGGFITIFLVVPLVNVFAQALANGWRGYIKALTLPESVSAIKLTLTIAAISLPLNMIFGIAAAWAIAKFEFRGKAFFISIIDLPFSVSPPVAGLIFINLFGLQGYFGQWLQAHDIKIIFALPGMVLATVFVTFPFIARELIPAMQSVGVEQEHAALTLGANGWQTFWRVTLPSIKWALIYGMILSNARAMGDYGAVLVVSSRISGLSNTIPLEVDKLYQEYNSTAAFALASLLTLVALLTLGVKTFLEWQTHREQTRAQTISNSNPAAK